MFRQTRAHIEQAIDDATNDVHALTDHATKTADALVLVAAALALVTMVALIVSLTALDRSNQCR